MSNLKEHRKKFSLKLIFIYIVAFFTFSNPSYCYKSSDKCSLIIDSIKKNSGQLALDKPIFYGQSKMFLYPNDYLLRDIKDNVLKFTDNPKKIKITDFPFSRTKNNYVILAYSVSTQVDSHYKPNSIIFSINGVETSKMNDKEVEEAWYINWRKIKNFEILEKDGNEEKKYEYKRKEVGEWYRSVMVWAHVSPNNITNINTIEGTFDARYKFEARWFPEKILKLVDDVYSDFLKKDLLNLNESIICSIDEKALEGIYKPNLILSNKIQDYEETKVKYILDYHPGRLDEKDKTKVINSSADIIMTAVGSAKFKADFDFRSFPFDKQELKFKISESDVYSSWGSFVHIAPSYAYHLPKFLTDYKNLNLVEWNKSNIDIKFSKKSFFGVDDWERNTVMMEVVYIIDRHFNYFIFKIILPIVIILILAWSTFWISIRELEARLTVSVVCFLSLVAYTFVIDESLPKLAYLTVMDMFILLSYVFSAIPTFQSIYASHLIKKDNISAATKYDEKFKKYIPITFIVLTFIGFIIFSGSSINTISAFSFF